MRVQLMPLRSSRSLRKTLRSSTSAFSGWRSTASRRACSAETWRICGVQPVDAVAHFGELGAVRRSQRNQDAQRAHQQQAHGNGCHQQGAVAPERLAGKIDGNVHTNSSWKHRTTCCVSRAPAAGGGKAAARVPGGRLAADAAQIAQQAGVAFPRHAQRRPQRLHVHAQLLRRSAPGPHPSARRSRTAAAARPGRPGCLPRRRTWAPAPPPYLPGRRAAFPGSAPA